MPVRKILSVMLSLCVLLTIFAALPSARVQAMMADIVVIDSATAAVRSAADPAAASLALVTKNSTFLRLDSSTGTDGAVWYRILHSSSISGWVSSADSSAVVASSAVSDPNTLYLKRVVRVAADSFVLRAAPGTSSAEVATVTKNERMVVVGYDDDPAGITWYEVRYGTVNGWIKRTAVEMTNICSAPAPLDCSVKTPVIYLSPSRQPANPFATGNTNEWEQMTRVANALKPILEERYDCVVHMAQFETPISKFNRPLEAHELGTDIYLAIHSNAGGGAGHGYGTQAYYFPGSAQNKLMAENLVKAISAIAPFTDDAEGAINGMNLLGGCGYGEVRDPGGFGMLSILLEVEFHDHADSAQWIIDNTDAIAAAIADGLDATFHFRPRSTAPTTATTTTTTTTTAATQITAPPQDGHSPLGTTTATTTSTTTTTATTISTVTTTASTTTTTTETTQSTTAATTAPTAPSTPEIIRAGGSDRIETAAEISALGWDHADTVIIASGSSYPDALAGVPLSYAVDAPILLTMGKDGAEDTLLAEITRLGAKNAYILGGEAAVSAKTEADLTAVGLVCTRLAGGDRYETCVTIARELARLTGSVTGTLYFVSADNYPDALAVSPVAAMDGAPILYIGSDSELHAVVAEFAAQTGCASAVLLGGDAAVSARGQSSIEALGMSVERISGADRYATGLAVVDRFADRFGGDGAALATGRSFPDALAGGAHAAKLGIPLLLTDNGTSADLLACASKLNRGDIFVYGGENAVSKTVAKDVLAAIS